MSCNGSIQFPIHTETPGFSNDSPRWDWSTFDKQTELEEIVPTEESNDQDVRKEYRQSPILIFDLLARSTVLLVH